MQHKKMMVMLVVAMGCALTLVGCAKKSESNGVDASEGVGERTGAAVDAAAEKTMDAGAAVVDKTADAAKAAAKTSKEVTGKVVEKTGEVVEKAGDAVKKTGTGMRNGNDETSTE